MKVLMCISPFFSHKWNVVAFEFQRRSSVIQPEIAGHPGICNWSNSPSTYWVPEATYDYVP